MMSALFRFVGIGITTVCVAAWALVTILGAVRGAEHSAAGAVGGAALGGLAGIWFVAVGLLAGGLFYALGLWMRGMGDSGGHRGRSSARRRKSRRTMPHGYRAPDDGRRR